MRGCMDLLTEIHIHGGDTFSAQTPNSLCTALYLRNYAPIHNLFSECALSEIYQFGDRSPVARYRYNGIFVIDCFGVR
jgi:hypothetical protein